MCPMMKLRPEVGGEDMEIGWDARPGASCAGIRRGGGCWEGWSLEWVRGALDTERGHH